MLKTQAKAHTAVKATHAGLSLARLFWFFASIRRYIFSVSDTSYSLKNERQHERASVARVFWHAALILQRRANFLSNCQHRQALLANRFFRVQLTQLHHHAQMLRLDAHGLASSATRPNGSGVIDGITTTSATISAAGISSTTGVSRNRPSKPTA